MNYDLIKADPDWEIDGIAYRQLASDNIAKQVLASPRNEGCSPFYWFRLANGDLILGVYPQADTYMETESDRSI
jgi:hypothetical protein